MLAGSIRILTHLLLFGGVVSIAAGGVLFWDFQSQKTLPPPIEKITGNTSGVLPLQLIMRPRSHISPPLPLATPEPLRTALPSRLTIPSVGIDGKVVAAKAWALEGGTGWEIPLEDIAWYVGTALPGNKGNAVMSGHVVTRSGGGVFRNLYRIRKGYPIYIHTDEGSLTYYVTGVRVVLPTDISVLTNTSEPTLTLITCAGDFDEATRTFSHRLVVTAKLGAGTE